MNHPSDPEARSERMKALNAGEPLPRQMGPYRLESILGEGGMGRVYLASQEEPVRRKVAVKILRFSVDTPQMRFRFERERHAMGRLDHPNIGKILEAGTTDRNRPYLTMEYIDGVPITQYCDDRGLGIEDRLRLFVGVCRGTDHAHNKLILHRDLKPGNVLVTEVDGQPYAKIIDFGIAKDIADPRPGKHDTRHQIVGTPAYMSPESLGLAGDFEPDTRSDVFSLGVLLYELLTGHRPRHGEMSSVVQAVSSHIEALVRPPSGMVRRLDASTRDQVANRRRQSAKSLPGLLRGDLDGIVMRAIEEEPDDRYGSAGDLADDIQRHLNQEPVSVRAPTFGYVLGKLYRRHRLAVLSSAVALVAVLLGILATTFGLVRARRAEALARQEAIAAVEARDETQEVVDFLLEIFRGSGVEGADANKPVADRTARELLDAGAQRIKGELQDQPAVKARILSNIGIVYRQLGLYEAAERYNQDALALLQSMPEPRVDDRIDVLQTLATIAIHTSDLAAADAYLQRALDVLPADQLGQTRHATLMDTLGRVKRRRQMFGEAESLGTQAIAIMRDAGESRLLDLAKCINNLGTTYFVQGKWESAEVEFREFYAMMRELRPPGHVLRAHGAQNLGAAIASQGRNLEARPLFEQALREQRAIHGDAHPAVASTLNSLGVMSNQLGDHKQAEAYHKQALAIRESMLGGDHPMTALSLDNLARSVADQGRIDDAIALQSRAARIRESKLGASHDDVSRSLEHLSQLYLARKDYTQSRAASERALSIQRDLEESHPETIGRVLLQLGKADWFLGNKDQARSRFSEAARVLKTCGDHAEDAKADAREWLAKFEAP